MVAKPDKRHILILDNASWHKSKRINWHHFEPMFLPSYLPDFNPIERLWLRVKADWFSDFIAHDKPSLSERLCKALNSFFGEPAKTASICTIRK
ncbi:transposase [Verrucomicrobia bacterium]|nr:transposase [Verrucomicrobiota bacterium]